MALVAEKEKLSPEVIMEGVAAGRIGNTMQYQSYIDQCRGNRQGAEDKNKCQPGDFRRLQKL